MSLNAINMKKSDYLGALSTLCKGCGHDSITSALVHSFYELSVSPNQIIKLSGIGCSSKTPNYFLNQSFGFNSVHGRMASLATGVHLSQPQAKLIGISGDGDTASIGLGGFLHLIRKNVPVVYIIANNGVYGLTKGQFSATSQKEDSTKSQSPQTLPEMDLAQLALVSGCDFVARSFSGNLKELKGILSAAFAHNGTAVIDIVSPCVAFGNNEEFSKSYYYTKDHVKPVHEIDLIIESAPYSENDLEYNFIPNEEVDHDPSSYTSALNLLTRGASKKNIYTGVIYKNPQPKPPLAQTMNLSKKERFHSKSADLRLSDKMWDKVHQL